MDEVLTTHPAIVALSPSLLAMSAHLHGQLAVIQQAMQPLLLKKSGYSLDKKAAKQNLARLLAIVCGALKSYASASADHSLYQKANLAYSSFHRMRDTELQASAAALHALAQQHAAGILPYNVGAPVIASLGTAVEQFKKDNPLPRTVMINSKTQRHLLFQQVDMLNDYLRLQMDPVAGTFQLSHPEFYRRYRNARRNYTEGIRHQEAGAPDHAQEAPAAPPTGAIAAFDRALEGLREGAAGSIVPVG